MAARKILYDSQYKRQARSNVLMTVWFIVALLILSRIFYLQIIRGKYYFVLSMENMMRLKINEAPRGYIYDKNQKIIARNRPSYTVSLIWNKIEDQKALKKNLLKIRNRSGKKLFSEEVLKENFHKARFRQFQPIKIADDVGLDIVSVVEEHSNYLKGVIIEKESRREYPYGKSACHVLGYMSEIPEEKYDSLKKHKGYNYGDQIGVFGLEKQYEDLLRGKNGHAYVMVNAFGREIGKIEGMPVKKAERGRDIFISIDIDLQLVAENAFPDSLNGAVVVINPQNGEIMAMVSSPGFDPNIFSLSSKKRSKLWSYLVLDPSKPLTNRATNGLYPPASTFKMVTALAALNENIIYPDEKFKSCTGKFKFGKRYFKCWKRSGHGRLNVIGAIKHSCDVYFYQIGLKTGIDYINKYAELFGFGSITEIDLPEEASGELLDEDLYNKKFEKRGWVWTKGQILNSSIGQGQVVTPLQLANYIAALTNGNKLFRPHLLVSINDDDSLRKLPVKILNDIKIDTKNIDIIKKALLEVIEPGGTGGWARVKGIKVGGKTGTAQNPQGEDHALFVAAAPLEDPVIALSVVVENSGHGGSVAAPIAGNILRFYFNRNN